MTTNENANKILAVLESMTYGEADEALHVAADYLAQQAQAIIAVTPISNVSKVSKPRAVWTPPKNY